MDMICDINYVLATLNAEGLSPNRALGQNFFVAGTVLRDLVRSFDPKGRQVLEIGPGLGALTQLLLEEADSVTAVEKDARLCELASESLGGERLKLICGDALKVPLDFVDEDWYACGNLPYYITTELSERLVCLLPRRLMLMVQREAAPRFTAQPGDRVYTPLSIVTTLFYEVECAAELGRELYYPKPDVDSVVLMLSRRDTPIKQSPADILRFARRCLTLRRKTLYNNLKSEEGCAEHIEACGLSPSVRAEQLTPAQFAMLCAAFERD